MIPHPPPPPPDRHEYQTVFGVYFWNYPYHEMKAIMKSKTFTGDMWRIGQECKRLRKAISKAWPFKQILNYLQ